MKSCVSVGACVCIEDELSFTPAELEKLQTTLNMTTSDINDVIGACEFIFQQVWSITLILSSLLTQFPSVT